jgi:DNA polymerase-1
MGVDLVATTPSGKLLTDKSILLPLAGLTPGWETVDGAVVNPLAEAVVRAKRAEKWRVAYAEAFIRGIDADGRVHPSISPLQARTGRMSISDPPLQQLPAGDKIIRKCMVADEGNVLWSVDYQQVELRVLAALADERNMKAAIAAGRKLHNDAAERIWGSGYTDAQYKLTKVAGFCTVYGGGAAAIDTQTGCGLEAARGVRNSYLRSYPGIRRYSDLLARQAERSGYVLLSRTGRRLPLDRDRLYSAINYTVQSTARDVFAAALLRLDSAGLTPYLLLPIHDELLGQAPEAEARELSAEVARIMQTTLDGVHLDTDCTVIGTAWTA